MRTVMVAIEVLVGQDRGAAHRSRNDCHRSRREKFVFHWFAPESFWRCATAFTPGR
jgi:hypothetical protein